MSTLQKAIDGLDDMMPDTHQLLVVEDDILFRGFLTQLLSRAGYDIQAVENGRQAITYLKHNSVALILLDVDLPDIDGNQVMEYIQSECPATMVVFMTGYSSVAAAVDSLKKGAYDYLEKPFESGKLLKTIKNALDRRRLEFQHKQSEQEILHLVENSLIGIAIIQDNRVIYSNQNLEDIFGPLQSRTPAELFDCIHPDDVDKLKEIYAAIVAGSPQITEIEIRLYPGGASRHREDMRWVQVRAASFKYRGQDAILLNIIDTTNIKQLEQQLIIRNKMISLGRIAAGIAHEIRNPLTGINSYLYTLQDICSSDSLAVEELQLVRQIVNQLTVASHKIESVVKRVMDFSKPGAPKMMLTDLQRSIEEVIKLSAVTMRKNGIQVETEVAANLPQCYADPQLIEQVILNLITNAAQAMKKTNADKRVLINAKADKNMLSIRISDSGPGVPPELREKIFDPFFTTKEDGSGIGLNIAQRIVADHNGTISLNNSKWGGAEFRIDLPIERRMNPR